MKMKRIISSTSWSEQIQRLKRPTFGIRNGPLQMQVLDTAIEYDPPDTRIMKTSAKKVAVCRVYGVDREGASICMSVYGFRPRIYFTTRPLMGPDSALSPIVDYIEELLAMEDERRGWSRGKNFQYISTYRMIQGHSLIGMRETPMYFLEITLASPQFFYAIQRQLRENDNYIILNNTTYYPYNMIDPVTQFANDKQIVGFGWVEVPAGQYYLQHGLSSCCADIGVWYNNVHALPETNDVAPLRVLSFDIECATLEKRFPTPELDPVIVIAAVLSDPMNPLVKTNVVLQYVYATPIESYDGNETLHESFETEEELLEAWGELVETYDPDIINGFNETGFDIPYLVQRAHILSVEGADYLGRDNASYSVPRTNTRSNRSGVAMQSTQTKITGRVQLDSMEMMKQRPEKERMYSLNHLSSKYLNSTKEDVGYAMINPMWETSPATRQRLGTYCLKDAILSMQLMDKFVMVHDLIEMSRITRVMPQVLLRKGQQEKVWMQLMHECTHNGFGDGLQVFIPQESHSTRKEKFSGATVLDPKVGYYDKPIAVADFSSLYPSIIIAHNICYSTQFYEDRILHYEHDVSPNGLYFVHEKHRCGILPNILKKLLAARYQAKREMVTAATPFEKTLANSRQLALKISANSCYGFLGTSGGKLSRVELAEAVTRWGKEMIQTSKTIMEKEYHATVIYGDTDSVMVDFPGTDTIESANAKLAEACDRVNKEFKKPICLMPEKIYWPYLIQAKKKYVALKYEGSASPVIDKKGIEIARRDNCRFVVDVLTRAVSFIMEKRDIPGAIECMKNAALSLVRNTVDIEELIITKSLSKKSYAAPQPHSELAARMKRRDPTTAPTVGDRVPFVIVSGRAGNRTCDKSEDPIFVMQHDIPIDGEFYLDHQLRQPALRIFAPILGSEKRANDLLFGQVANVKTQQPCTDRGIGMFFKSQKKCLVCSNWVTTPAKDKQYCEKCFGGPAYKEYELRKKQEICDLEDLMRSLRAKCAECRGYDDDTQCVQRDCTTMYKKVKTQKMLNKYS